MEDTMLELVKICQQKEFLCIHDDVDDLIESALNTKILTIKSQHLDKKEEEVKNIIEQPAEHGNRSIQSLKNFRVIHKSSISLNTSQISSIHAVAPILSTKELEHLLSMGYEHLSITPEMESDKVTKSNVENLLPILSECDVTLEDESKCDVPISENSPVCDNHSKILSDSKINDDISVYDDDFEDIEYVEEPLTYHEIVSVEEENYENYLYNLCGNNSHDGYDCQQKFPFVYEQELSYNQNYDEEPPQDSDIRQLIREECCTEVCEEQKQSMEDTMLELVKICQEKEFICIHDDVDDLIESALNSKLLLINLNSQHLDKKEHEVKNIVEHQSERGNHIAPILSTKEPENLLSMGYEHLSITPETESDEVTESNAENLLPILSKREVTSKDEIECDVPANDDCSPTFTTFSNPLFNNDDLDFSDDELLPDEDVLAEDFKVYSNPLFDEDEINSDKLDPHCFNVESNFVESLLNHDTFIDYSSKFDFSSELAHEEIDVVTETDDVLPPSVENDDDSSNDPLLEEVDLFLFDNSIPPGIENIADDPEGDIRFLEELLIDDSILSHESFDFNFEDNPSIPRPPPEPPDVETDLGE
nr:hypothetical protein [Tanacetum cinerariifolium]